jgi:hypothetical protein
VRRLALALASILAVAALGPVGCGNGPGAPGAECLTDTDCGGDVCTRTHECLPADQVHSVMLRWTISSAAASDSACTTAGIDHLEVSYLDDYDGEQITYAPVPCGEGQFLVDKLPTRYDAAEITALAPGGSVWADVFTQLDAGTVDVTLNLR